VEFGVDALQICQSDLLLEDHFVKTDDKVCIQESTMEDTKTKTSTNELEVVQMFRVDTGCRVDLERIIVVGRVLEQAVEWIEHLMGQQEEEFSVSMLVIIHYCLNETTYLDKPP
jgi:hypothetical protein